MTKEELVIELTELQEPGDIETSHIDADILLLEYIDDPEVKVAFLAIERWYA